MNIIIYVLHLTIQVLQILIIIQAILSFFMSPFHPVRQALNRVVEPLLAPIRRVLPPMGMFDFSPFVALILLSIIDRILISL